MIPLFETQGHKLTSLKGEVSSFFEVLPPDLEQVDGDSSIKILREIERSLMNLEGVLKVYWLKGKLYFNTFSDFEISYGEMIPCDRPVEVYLLENGGEINYYENYLTVGPEFIRVLSLKEFPENIRAMDSSGYPDFVMHLRRYNPIKAKNKLNFKRKLHFSALYKGMRDMESENAFNEAESLLEDVTRNERALFDVEVFFLVRGSSKIELDQATKVFIEQFKLLGASFITEERGLSFFHLSTIPGVAPSFKRDLPVPSDYLSHFVPMNRDYVMGNGMALHARSGSPVMIEIFNSSSPNYNVLVTGSSGQGKSMIANKILRYELGSGTKGIVLDLGNSFRKNALYHGGVILSEKFNPLQFKNPRYLKEFVLSVIDDKLGKREEGRLYEIIKETVETYQDIDFDEFLKVLETNFKGISFYFSEIKDFITDEVLELNDFTYCDFGHYPESKKAPLIIYLIEYFKHLSGRKIFIFDECWHLLSKNADYIAECFRTFRKYDASAVAISQNLDDFCETQLGRVIMQNTFYKLLFKQSVKSSEFLDDHLVELMSNILSRKGEYSEFLLLTETIRKPIRFYPDPFEYQLFTSDRRDNAKFEFYMEEKGRFLDFKEAMENFTKIKNPNWGMHDEEV